MYGLQHSVSCKFSFCDLHLLYKSHQLCHIFIFILSIFLTQNGSTPLCLASENGHSDVVNILIRNGANVNLARNVWRYNVPYTHTV